MKLLATSLFVTLAVGCTVIVDDVARDESPSSELEGAGGQGGAGDGGGTVYDPPPRCPKPCGCQGPCGDEDDG